jgi:hypothetical protein
VEVASEWVEVGQPLAFAKMQRALDLVDEHVARPPVFGCLRGIPEPRLGIVQLVEQRADVTPGNLCHGLWHFLLGRRSSGCRGELIGGGWQRPQRAGAAATDSGHCGELALDLAFYCALEAHE